MPRGSGPRTFGAYGWRDHFRPNSASLASRFHVENVAALIQINNTDDRRLDDGGEGRPVMPVSSILVLAGIVAAFSLFGVVLAWAERQTSGILHVEAAPDQAEPELPPLKKAA